VDKNSRAEAYTKAILDQLNAEIGASDYTVKSLAGALEKDYNTFRRWVIGEKPMPMVVLWAAIDQLGIPQLVFAQRAQDRYENSAKE